MSNEIETLREKIARQNKKIRKLLLNIAEQGVTIKLIMKGLAEADGENHRTDARLARAQPLRSGRHRYAGRFSRAQRGTRFHALLGDHPATIVV